MVRANKCILGCNGISSKSGVTTRNIMEVSVNQSMISNCIGVVYVLAHSYKVGITSNFKSAPIEKVDVLITDTQADPTETSLIASHNVQIVQLSSLNG